MKPAANRLLGGIRSPSGSGNDEVFLAKFGDTGSSVSDGGAVSGGGLANDVGYAVAVGGGRVYVAGSAAPFPTASFGSSVLNNPIGNESTSWPSCWIRPL